MYINNNMDIYSEIFAEATESNIDRAFVMKINIIQHFQGRNPMQTS